MKHNKMHDIWQQLETALVHSAPELLPTLAPGAAEEEIRQLEVLLGRTLPSDIRDSWLIHNGQQGVARNLGRGYGLLDTWQLLSLQEIGKFWRMLQELFLSGEFDLPGEAVGPVQPVWWHPAWIPFTNSGTGHSHCLDLAPASGGQVGQIIIYWKASPDRKVVAPGLGSLLTQVAEGLAAGTYWLDREYGGIIEKSIWDEEE